MKRILKFSVAKLALITIGIFTLAPFLWAFLSSLKAEHNIFSIPPTLLPESLGTSISNYVNLFHLEPVGFGRIFLNTLFITICFSIGSLLISSLAGFAFAKYDFKFKKFLFYLVIATMMIPFQVLVIPLYQEMVFLGWVDSYLALIVPFLGRAYTVFLLRQFMLDVPSDLLDAARIDGCTEFGIFWKIAIPLVKPGLVLAGIFNFIYMWGLFLWPLVITSSPEKYVVSLFLSNLITARTKLFGELFAGTTLSFVIVGLLFFLVQRQLFKSLEIGFGK
ncbi:carbohydrate ABC transporter permease [Candidatus Bipolaricaulota bacterium]|nr:carbohydrate ABC transporter permease [Candidatus Bipolaricaulota bacterium]